MVGKGGVSGMEISAMWKLAKVAWNEWVAFNRWIYEAEMDAAGC